QNLKSDDAPLFHGALQLLRGGLRRAHRQHTDALYPIGKRVVFGRKMIVATACHADRKRNTLKPDDAPGAGRKTVASRDPMIVHKLVPAGDLFVWGELAPDSFRLKGVEHMIVPRLVARPQRR